MKQIRLTENDIKEMVNASVRTILEGSRPIYRQIGDYEDYDGEEEIAGIDDENEEKEEPIEATSVADFNQKKDELGLPFEVQTFHEQRVGDKGIDLVIYPGEFIFDNEADDWKILGLDWDYAPGQMCVVGGEKQDLAVGKIPWLDKEVLPKVELKIKQLMSEISQEN